MASNNESTRPKGTGFTFAKTSDVVNHFVTSGAAVCVATGMTHPLDVVKVRLQMEHVGWRAISSGMTQKLVHMVENEGLQSLYKGIGPSLLRSAVYGGLRLGLYEPNKVMFEWAFDSTNFLTKLAAGALSGATATDLTNPMEVLKVRMQASYDSSKGAMVRELKGLVAGEGLVGLWRGVGPSTARASALTASQMSIYDESKQILKHWMELREGFWLHLSASFIAGLVGTFATAPLDTVKTRMMMQRDAINVPYRNSLDCAYKVLRSEGFSGLYKGWGATLARLGPQTAITFLVYEKLREVAGIRAL